jgi:DHA1 family tetracycline resistance protein-like MFS transporter
MSLSSPPAAVSRHAVTFVLVTVFLDMLGFGIIMPVLPKLIGEVGHVDLADSARLGGWMLGAYSIAQFLFGPLMGNLSDRFGRRPLLLLAIFGLGLDFIMQALAPNLAWLFAGRILAGICGGSWVIANAFIADVTAPEDRAAAFGLMGAAFGLGFIFGPALGGVLGTYGARVPFFAAAGISAINLVYGLIVLPETLDAAHRRPFQILRANPFAAFRIFRSYRGVLPLCAVFGGFVFFTSAYQAIWTFWGIARLGWSPWVVGLSLAMFGLIVSIFQAGLSGPVVKALGDRRTVALGLVSAAIAAVGYGFVSNTVLVFALMVVHGPEGFIQPVLGAVLSNRVPENAQGELQGAISAMVNLASLAGTLFYAQLFGFFLSPGAPFQSASISFLVMAVGLVAVLVAFLRLGPGEAKGAVAKV